MKLLWASFALGFVHVFLLVLFDQDSRESAAFLLVFVGVASAAYATLIVYARRCQNWARTALLVVTAVSAVFLLIPGDEPEPLWSTGLTIVSSLLEIPAVFWLFSGAGAAWYREGAQSAV